MKLNVRPCLVLILAATCIIAPLVSLMVLGVFSWHIRQPAALQGGSVLLVLFLCVYVALKYLGKLRWIPILVCLWVYFRNQGVDLSVVIVYLYVESIFALGGHLLPLVGFEKDQTPQSTIVAGVLGTIGWSLCIWVFSWFGFGGATELRWLALCILGLASISSGGPRLAKHVAKQMDPSGTGGNAFNAISITMFALLFAKTAVAVDYDSMWYGLVGDRVLVGNGGLFSSEGLVAAVHYYPKLYESLLVPLSGIGSVSVIFGLAVFSWVLILYTVSLILQEVGVRGSLRAPLIALVATLPALANISITAKGDAFSAWLICVAIYSALKFRATFSPCWFWLSISAILMGAQARLSSIPYAGMVLVVLVIFALEGKLRWGKFNVKRAIVSRPIMVLLVSLLLTLLITLRTYILAGVPVIAPDSLVQLAESVGLEVKFPAGRLAFSAWPHLPPVITIFSYLFDPRRYSHLALYWTGNFWLFILLWPFMYGAKFRQVMRRGWPFALIGVLFFVILLGFRFEKVAGADGNYFIIPLICLALLGAIAMQEARKSLFIGSQRLISFSLFLFAVTSAAICLVSASWGPGTRSFDLVMTRSPLDYAGRQAGELQNASLSGVASFFKDSLPGSRVIGVAPAPDSWWLPIRYEPIDVISWSRPEVANSPESMRDFLYRDSIRYVVLRSGEAPAELRTVDSTLLVSAVAEMERVGGAIKVYSDGYYEIWKLALSRLIKLADGSYMRIQPIGNPECASSKPFPARVTWDVKPQHVDSVRIFVEAPLGGREQLWSQSGSAGSQSTGNWVLPRTKFLVRDVASNRLILSGEAMSCDAGTNNP